MYKKYLEVPADEFMACTTDEERKALVDRYTVELTAEEWEAYQAEQAAELARVQKLAEIAESDAKMARVTEDVVFALVAKGVIDNEDLPVEAVAVLQKRKELREQAKQ